MSESLKSEGSEEVEPMDEVESEDRLKGCCAKGESDSAMESPGGVAGTKIDDTLWERPPSSSKLGQEHRFEESRGPGHKPSRVSVSTMSFEVATPLSSIL